MSYALALFCVNHGLAQPLLLVEELAVELRKLFIAGLADAEQDCLELLQVLCCCRHRHPAARAWVPGFSPQKTRRRQPSRLTARAGEAGCRYTRLFKLDRTESHGP